MRNKEREVPWRLRSTEDLEERQLMEAETGGDTLASPFCLPSIQCPTWTCHQLSSTGSQLGQEPGDAASKSKPLCVTEQSRGRAGTGAVTHMLYRRDKEVEVRIELSKQHNCILIFISHSLFRNLAQTENEF